MVRILADVFIAGGANRRISTTPGRSIQFSGGRAQVVDHRDMPHVLQMENTRVYPHPDAMPWVQDWLAQCTQIRARVYWPKGWRIAFRNQNEFRVTGPKEKPVEDAIPPKNPPGVPTTSEPVTTVDITARPTWIRPEALLEGPTDDNGTADADEGAGAAGGDRQTEPATA